MYSYYTYECRVVLRWSSTSGSGDSGLITMILSDITNRNICICELVLIYQVHMKKNGSKKVYLLYRLQQYGIPKSWRSLR